MEILIAIGHIVGAVFVSIIIGMVILFISSWEQERNLKAAMEELSVRLGVPIVDLEDDENIEKYTPKIIQISLDRFSDELFKNRLSDLCGFIRTAWDLLGNIVQVLILRAVAWYSFTDTLDIAVYAWLINVIIVVFLVVSVLFALLCKLLTGRYPGQAKAARKFLANCVNSQNNSKVTNEQFSGA